MANRDDFTGDWLVAGKSPILGDLRQEVLFIADSREKARFGIREYSRAWTVSSKIIGIHICHKNLYKPISAWK